MPLRKLFTDNDILERLQRLQITKSPGVDKLHPRILFELRHEIVYPLTIIFNKSYESRRLPLDWRSANISAIYKKR